MIYKKIFFKAKFSLLTHGLEVGRGRPLKAFYIYTSSRNPHLQHVLVPEAALRPQDDLGTASKNGLKRPQAASDDLKRPLMVSNLEKGRFSFKNLEISSPRQNFFLKFQNFKIV